MKRLALFALPAFLSLGAAAQAADLGPGYEAPRARIIARERVVERYEVVPERRVYVERRYAEPRYYGYHGRPYGYVDVGPRYDERPWRRWGWRHHHW